MPSDWLDVVTLFGADPTGADDSTAAIQDALTEASDGQVVYLPLGTYQVSAPLVLPAGTVLLGASGWDAYAFGDVGTVIVPSASFSGAAVLCMADSGGVPTQGAVIRNIGIDGSSLPGSTDGIGAFGPVIKTVIDNVAIANCTGWGINNSQDPAVSSGNSHPYDWEVSHVRIHHCAGGGANLPDHTDATWADVYVLGCAGSSGHGFQFTSGPANSHFTNCRAEWTGGTGDGFHLTGAWNTGTGSGGFTMTGCSTDRSQHNGFYCDATGTAPVILTGCTFRRDGRNGGAGGGGYAAVRLSSATVPVILNGITVFPGTDDDGAGTSSPQLGITAANSRYLAIVSGWVHAASTAISNGGGNTVFRQNPNVATATGPTASPAISYGNSWGTDNGSDWTIAGGGRLYSGSQAAPPACAAGPNAGTSAPAPVVTKATDMAGQITFGTGRAPSAGAMVHVTFRRAYGTVPYVVLCPLNAATAHLGVWVASPASTGFSVGVANAPAASQPRTKYAVCWIVVG
jgi:Pectate lyase superfamily protein